MGGSFIAFGLFISSLTKNQIVAGVLTFCTLLMLLLVGWLREFVGPVGQAIVSALAVFEHFEDFSKGVLDTKHIVYYLSCDHVRPVPDREVGRQRAVARIAAKRIRD